MITFSDAVNFIGSVAGAFKLQRAGAGGTVGDVSLIANPTNGPANTITITFSGGCNQCGSLVDGFCEITIDASKESCVKTRSMAMATARRGNYAEVGIASNKWFRLFGDEDGDGFADNVDLIAFRRR